MNLSEFMHQMAFLAPQYEWRVVRNAAPRPHVVCGYKERRVDPPGIAADAGEGSEIEDECVR